MDIQRHSSFIGGHNIIRPAKNYASIASFNVSAAETE
jgi:hypothetical protein